MSKPEIFKKTKILRDAFPNPSENGANRYTSPTGKRENFEQCYAIGEDGKILKRFELIQNNGRRFSFSYALLPICIQEDSSLLYLKAYELLITISGFYLDPIREYINSEQLVWARASPSGKQLDQHNTFIKNIIIEGETVITTL